MSGTNIGAHARMIGLSAPAGPQIAPEQRRAMAMQLAVTCYKIDPDDMILASTGTQIAMRNVLIDTARAIEAYLRGDASP